MHFIYKLESCIEGSGVYVSFQLARVPGVVATVPGIAPVHNRVPYGVVAPVQGVVTPVAGVVAPVPGVVAPFPSVVATSVHGVVTLVHSIVVPVHVAPVPGVASIFGVSPVVADGGISL